ncbi:MAG: chemotaxis response regulator protein-glutamate methylesterase [Candidatus Eisenbacteria bacterium]|uniref:Protein-glutamate methylesterase/protein-glutamine glutaminase n=1 Tax=Eiseniibacteriota bacterium TaxID=2212470 RepID=A0A937X633_UNCEI|nr:chemotaxis response regulator protein-glutamate methylesterase [Candidatus Eisenbacteria bacterium]
MIRLLIVDDSAVVRHALTRQLGRDPEIEVVGAAPDPYAAREMIARLRPHVLTLDLDMPRMDGITFLGKLMAHHPLPVIVVSSHTPHGSRLALQALELGAIDVIGKPESAYAVGDLAARLTRAIKCAAMIDVRKLAPPGPDGGAAAARGASADDGLPGRGSARMNADAEPANASGPLGVDAPLPSVVAIGASTGGTRAVAEILRLFPAAAPATLIVQHMPPGFTSAFAQRLDQIAAMCVREAADGDLLAPGLALVAPGDWHMTLLGNEERCRVRLRRGPRVHFQRPSVEVLFDSLAETIGDRAVGIILTGMGADGAEGLLGLRRAGARTIAQDEATSVVFGMPREAIGRGAAGRVLPLGRIAAAALAPREARAA